MTGDVMKRQSGVGLIEVMVSITIGLLVMTGVMQLYVSSIESQKSQEGSSRIQENLRYLTTLFYLDTSKTGNFGCTRFEQDMVFSMLGHDIDEPKPNEAPGPFNFKYYISGTEGDGLNGSDTVSLRFMNPDFIPLKQEFKPAAADAEEVELDVSGGYKEIYDTIKQWNIAVFSDCSKAFVAMVTDEPTAGKLKFRKGVSNTDSNSATFKQFNEAIAPTLDVFYPESGQQLTSFGRIFVGGPGSHTYEIRKSARGNNSADGDECSVDSPHSCALFRDSEEVIDGVSDLQFEYGWQDDTKNVYFGDADAVSAAESWALVDRIKMDVTLVSLESAATNDGQNGNRLLKIFSQIFFLQNRPVEG